MMMFKLHQTRTMIRSLALVLVTAAACMVSAVAQSASAGIVTGTVVDPQGAVIPGAMVTLTDLSTKMTRTTSSNSAGLYVVPDVVPGHYAVTVTKSGFATDTVADLEVSVGTQSTANFKMVVGAESTTISVEASTADLQTMNASTGQTVDPTLVESLPALGRDASTFVTFEPGVTPGGNVAGTAADQAVFMLDGGNNSSDMDGTQGVYTNTPAGSTTGGFIGAGPGGVIPTPQDSVEEFKVTTSGQTADFNNSSGSQSQVVTKRGRDQVHGTVYEYYLDNNFNGNTWQNNYGSGTSSFVPKPSYHYSRFGVAAGGPITPKIFGGKTYLFANYEGFRYPLSATYERSVPSYEFLQLGQVNGTSAAALTAADPRHIGMSSTLKAFYNSQLPVAPAGNSGNVGFTGTTYAGSFDKSCGPLSGPLCDSVNTIGYRANLKVPQSSNFLATRLDHDFGDKWHLMASYRYYNLQNVTANQVDVGGSLAGDTLGVPTAVTPRPQQPWYFVVGLTTNVTPSITNDFHYSFTHNFWQWKGAGAPPQVSGAGGAIEPLGENSLVSVNGLPAGHNVLSPYNVNAQNIRTRIWNGKDNFLRDDVTWLKGNHLFQFGGQYQHNWNYHQRTDNGASINYTPTYQIGDSGGGGNIAYSGGAPGSSACTLNPVGLNCVGAGTAANARILDTYFGFVTDTQVANTYTNTNGTLTLNPPATPIAAKTSIPYYNLYATDTWHVKPTLTLNLGLSYALELPPQEANGNEVAWTDASGNQLSIQNWLNQKQQTALSGAVYNPVVGFSLLKNLTGSPKYLYNPYKTAFSPRISVAWNPRFNNPALNKIFGNGATVIRGGYGRIYARINGDLQVLNPLLSPSLILATTCKGMQSGTTGSGTCSATNYTDTTAFRFGPDGISPPTAAAPPPTTLPQPYRPGIDGPGVSIASPLDPSLRPSASDTFNLSVQRQINRKMLIEVGYIGRRVQNEYIMLNPNTVPYQMTLGGQSFASAYLAVETALGCTVSAGQCAKQVAPTNAAPLTPQPFFEAALGGATSAYCASAPSCTQAVINKQLSKFRQQQVFSLWQALDNNNGGAGGSGWTFGRSLMGTATSNATYGTAGQIVSGITVGTPYGYSNYNAGYVTFKISGWHGITLQENLTYSRALGLGVYNQSTSSITAEDSFNLREQYGRQGFDQKYIFNTFIVWHTPWYQSQSGILGRLAGGWTLSPVVVAGTGQPLTCTSNNNGQNFGGEDGSTITDNENCIFNTRYRGGSHTYRGITGGTDAYGNTVGTNSKAGPTGAASGQVNFFQNPVAAFSTVRPPILGLDNNDAGGTGAISGLGYLNVDLSVKKMLKVWERTNLEFSGTITNVMNHLDFSNPSLSLQSLSNWGTTKTQGNAPRQIQMGVRANF